MKRAVRSFILVRYYSGDLLEVMKGGLEWRTILFVGFFCVFLSYW